LEDPEGNMDFKLFGKRLRELRQAKGVSIKDLAPQLEISYMHLSNIEVGYKKPSPEFVERVARFFDADPDELKILAALIPDDISELLQRRAKDAPKYLRHWDKPDQKGED
jgi:transcriptional regulator with XRE-family HTH domain